MILHQLKIIFIHIRKTGGNSITLFLKDYVSDIVLTKESKLGKIDGIEIISELDGKEKIKHNYLQWYFENYSEKIFNNYTKFAVVRNPYDRMMSYYFYKSKQKPNQKTKFERKVFIRVLFALDTQVKYLKVDGKIPRDVIIVKYENMIDEMSRIEKLKNMDWNKFPQIDVSKNSILGNNKYQEFLTDELKKLIYKKFKEDFEIFGYTP